MKKEEKIKSGKMKSLSIQIPVIFILSMLIFSAAVVAIIAFRFHSRMIDEYTRMAKGVTNLMAYKIDPSKTEEYMEKNFEMDEYNKVLEELYQLKDNYPDVLYMYVYRIEEDGGHVIFDLDNGGDDEGDSPGTVYELDDAFVPYREDLMVGRDVPALSGRTQYGYLLTYMRPVFDENGNYKCHVCVDFSMDFIYKKDIKFIIGILVFIMVAVIFVLIMDIAIVRKKVTKPLSMMIKCTRNFKYGDDDDRLFNVSSMEELGIDSMDEIGELYNMFVLSLKESRYYMTSFNKAKIDILDKEEKLDEMSRVALFDSLTGVGNKAAFNKKCNELDKEIAENKACFAVIMADLNNLKYINDYFGHKDGDEYIAKCCNILSGIFKQSPVFRVGGDEFVIIIENDDYDNKDELYKKTIQSFADSYNDENKDRRERYSASLGMAVYSDEDENVKQVFVRADEDMYANKMEFNNVNGSYR
ncbi:MAG: GGDEF domain-containing protein [Lachnospiraceae bacterium]|nr:GGDEF domain-containing protein [Lachnospiraceae bacterium]